MERSVGISQEENSSGSCISDSESHVTVQFTDDCSFGDPELHRLCEDEEEHVLLKHRLYSSLGSAAKHCCVVAAYKNMHSTSSARARLEAFQLYSIAMMDKRGGNPNIRFAWYGTTKDVVDQIIQEGFSFRRTSENSGLYGLGVYLSSESSAIDSIVSAIPDDDGIRHVLLCRVILGNVEEVHLGSRQYNPSNEEFDSGVDNQKVPTKYIVWPTLSETHILPVFILSIRLDFHSKGFQMRPRLKPSSPWISLVTLISVISQHLPPSKVRLIIKLYNDYKESKITRQQFIYNLRQFSGDKLLMAALKSFQAKRRMSAMSRSSMNYKGSLGDQERNY